MILRKSIELNEDLKNIIIQIWLSNEESHIKWQKIEKAKEEFRQKLTLLINSENYGRNND